MHFYLFLIPVNKKAFDFDDFPVVKTFKYRQRISRIKKSITFTFAGSYDSQVYNWFVLLQVPVIDAVFTVC